MLSQNKKAPHHTVRGLFCLTMYINTVIYLQVSTIHKKRCVMANDTFVFEEKDHKTVVVKVGRSFDFRNAREFKKLSEEQVREGKINFILDFTNTGILDSTGLGAIYTIMRIVSPMDGRVVFASVSRPVQVVVQLTRTYKVFDQFQTVDEALESLS